MSQISFREFYLENILTFLWRQWSTLGVAGGARAEEKWVIDPESLLIFSLQITRYQPRLFDEILDWLVENSKWIDIQRLRGILKRKDAITKRLISTVASYVSQESKTNGRKWRTLSSLNKKKSGVADEMLFITKKGEPYPEVQHESAVFKEYGFIREDFSLRAMTKPVSVNTQSNIRFLLRTLFGIGSRAECILYLLTHEAGHPNEIANAIGVSARATQDTLIELAESGLVLTRIKGKRKIEYWLFQKKWWEFLFGVNFEEIKKPIWLDWISLYSALMNVWNVLNEIEKSKSDYMRSSKLRESMETISLEFEKSQLILPPIPGREVRPARYEEEFQNFIKRVLRSENGTSK
jgi:predicted transcriptional regulator